MTDISARRPSHHTNTKKLNPRIMGHGILEKLPLPATKNQYSVNEGDVISIFGKGERKRANFAKKLTDSLGKNKVATIDLSKVNDPGFYLKLEQRKRKISASDCMDRKRLEDRLRVALDANEWFDKPIQVLNLEERAKMWLILDLSEQPDAVIINRPTVIRQFNRKIRALRQVFRKTYVMTETIWNFPLSNTSNHTFELGKGAPIETFAGI